jgi:biopolymer transport protein ExbD
VGYIGIPNARNDRYMECDGQFVTIALNENSDIFIDQMKIYEPQDLSLRLSDCLEEKMAMKVVLKVDSNAEFGKIQKILNIVKTLGIKDVQLVTSYYKTAMMAYFEEKYPNVNKGLK